ncbi:MAG TPA: methylamine utilization protein [Bryobacteraceae bacterium]|nr:methylamine utilization protein [Bryobacteraceae bacterium]
METSADTPGTGTAVRAPGRLGAFLAERGGLGQRSPSPLRWFVVGMIVLCGLGNAATVSGRVELVFSQDPNVRKHLDYSGVVVWLEPVSGAGVVPVRARHAEMIQKDKTFLPHVLAVTVGTTVDFPNDDPIFHNAFSNYNGQIFDIGLYPPGTSRSIAFKKEGVVRVFCNIHPAMSAVIVVLRSPYFGVSNSKGAVQITEVPPGSYRVHVFHERATEQTLAALSRLIEVTAEGAQLPPIAVSESGYLQLPHKNKYGKDYPPGSDSGRYIMTKP